MYILIYTGEVGSSIPIHLLVSPITHRESRFASSGSSNKNSKATKDGILHGEWIKENESKLWTKEVGVQNNMSTTEELSVGWVGSWIHLPDTCVRI
jgi:hypothetical protein